MDFIGSSFGHGFHGRPARGNLPKPLHELLPNSPKLVPAILTGKWTFSHKARIPLPCQPLENIKCHFLFFLTPYLTKINIRIMFWFLIWVSKISVQRNIERQINVQKCCFWNQVPNIERTLFVGFRKMTTIWFGGREIAKNKVFKVLGDTL